MLIKLLLGIAVLVVLALLWLVARLFLRAGRVTPIHSDDPWLHQAVERARATYDDMRALLQDGQQVAVKFPLANAKQEIEHVWGGVQSADDDTLRVVIMTPLLAGPTPEGSLALPRTDLEDWQVFLPDGRIRGGFTTQAQLAVCRREGFSIPDALLQQEPHFADRIEFSPVAITP